jgi:hypothetical protein
VPFYATAPSSATATTQMAMNVAAHASRRLAMLSLSTRERVTVKGTECNRPFGLFQ